MKSSFTVTAYVNISRISPYYKIQIRLQHEPHDRTCQNTRSAYHSYAYMCPSNEALPTWTPSAPPTSVTMKLCHSLFLSPAPTSFVGIVALSLWLICCFPVSNSLLLSLKLLEYIYVFMYEESFRIWSLCVASETRRVKVRFLFESKSLFFACIFPFSVSSNRLGFLFGYHCVNRSGQGVWFLCFCFDFWYLIFLWC